MITERTQQGKAISRTKNGFKKGRAKHYKETQINMALKLLENYSYKEVEKMTKISRSTLIRAKRKEELIK